MLLDNAVQHQPGLRSKAFWGSEELPWLTDFENGFEDVKTEFLALRGRGGFQVRHLSFALRRLSEKSASHV